MKLISAMVLAASSVVTLSAYALTTNDMIGHAVNASPEQTINVNGASRVTVQQYEVVKLTDGNDSVVWQFDGLNTVIPLSKILPSAEGKDVKVYVQIVPAG